MNLVKKWLRETLPPSSSKRLYALLDCAIDDELPHCVIDLDRKMAFRSLFENTELSELADVGPLLIEVNQNSIAFQYVLGKMSKHSWGYFVLSDQDIDPLVAHFQKSLEARLPSGESHLFRFYDPNVMINQCKILSSEKLSELIGLGNFLMLPESVDQSWHFINDEGKSQA